MKRSGTFSPALKTVYCEAQQAYYDSGGTVGAGTAVGARIDGDSVGKANGRQGKQGISRLLEIAGPKGRQLMAACVLAVLSAATRLVPFYTTYLFVRELIFHWNDLSASNGGLLLGCALATIVAAVAHGLLGHLASMLAHHAAYDILFELRLRLTKKLAHLPSGYFTQVRQGELKKILIDDVEQIEGFVAHSITNIVCAVSVPFLTVGGLLFVDWRMALLLLVPIIASFAFMGRALASPEGAACQAAMTEAREVLSGTVVEFVHGMPVVKVFNRSLAAFSRFERDTREFAGSIKWATYFNANSMGMMYAAVGTQMLLLLPFVILTMPSGAGCPEFLARALLFFLAGGGMKEPVMAMISQGVGITSINASVERIDAILYEEELVEPAQPMAPADASIVFDRVSHSYDGKSMALDDVSFAVPAGSLVGIVGPSGSGKSTLASLVTRSFDPTQGSVRIGGVDVRNLGQNQMTQTVSSVLQASVLITDTLEANIRLGSQASEDELWAAVEAAQLSDVVSALPQGLATPLGVGGTRLSGGETQRVGVARAILRNTPIVVFDEATAYADAQSEARIQDAFARLAQNKSVLVVAHRMKTVRNADLIVVMDHGRVVAMGSHEQLMEQCALYRTLVDADARRNSWSIAASRGKE